MLFSNFLRQKIGEDKFDQVLKMLESSDNPMKILDEEQEKVLNIIGEENTDCIKFFKFIVNSQNSTPINS
jgi:NIMA (never in mitosis gene a)-related kinase